MPHGLLKLRGAVMSDIGSILRLIEERADWLRSLGIDQWSAPWPTEADRNRRVEEHLRAGKTWVVCSGELAVATLTTDLDAEPHWPEPARSDEAVYVHRLVVSRSFAGRRLGAQLLDWAGRSAARDSGARWLRVNARTTNERLHRYYLDLGFMRMDGAGLNAETDYPSAALFQRSARRVMVKAPVQFVEQS